MSKQDEQLLTSVILAPNETPEIIGRVFDEAITVLHARMQRGELPAAEFQRRLAEMQFIRDDLVSRAASGQQLPNGDRLCYFTPESLDWLNIAFSAVLENPANIGAPVEDLNRLHEKFQQARAAFRAQISTDNQARPENQRSYGCLVPALSGTFWTAILFVVWTFASLMTYSNTNSGQACALLLVGLVFFTGLAYLWERVARRLRFPVWLRIIAVASGPYSLPLVPFLFLLYLALSSGRSQTTTETISASAPAVVMTAVRNTGNPSVAVIERSTTPKPAASAVQTSSLDTPGQQSTSDTHSKEATIRPSPQQPADPPEISPLDTLRQRSAHDLERIATELFRSWGFEQEQSWPTGDGGFELVLRRDEQRALALYYPGGDRVPLDAVQEFHGRLSNQEAARGYLLTTDYGDPEAVRWAEEHAIEFVDGPTWIKRLREANLDGVV